MNTTATQVTGTIRTVSTNFTHFMYFNENPQYNISQIKLSFFLIGVRKFDQFRARSFCS